MTMGRINFKNSFTGEERVESRDVVEVTYAEELIDEVSGCTAYSSKYATDVGDAWNATLLRAKGDTGDSAWPSEAGGDPYVTDSCQPSRQAT